MDVLTLRFNPRHKGLDHPIRDLNIPARNNVKSVAVKGVLKVEHV